MQVEICRISVGQPFFGTIFSWVKFPFFGFNSPWGNLPWTKFHLGSITLGPFFLGQISEILSFLGFNYLGPKCFGLNFLGAMFIGLIYLGLNFLDRIPWTSLQCTYISIVGKNFHFPNFTLW